MTASIKGSPDGFWCMSSPSYGQYIHWSSHPFYLNTHPLLRFGKGWQMQISMKLIHVESWYSKFKSHVHFRPLMSCQQSNSKAICNVPNMLLFHVEGLFAATKFMHILNQTYDTISLLNVALTWWRFNIRLLPHFSIRMCNYDCKFSERRYATFSNNIWVHCDCQNIVSSVSLRWQFST